MPELIPFYCTAGRGTEKFVVKEIEKKLDIMQNEIHATDGRIHFSTDKEGMQEILTLKSIERVFLKVLHKQFEATNDVGGGQFVHLIQREILAEEVWKNRNLSEAIGRLIHDHDKEKQTSQNGVKQTFQNGVTKTAHDSMMNEKNAMTCDIVQHERDVMTCKTQLGETDYHTSDMSRSKLNEEIKKCISECETQQNNKDVHTCEIQMCKIENFKCENQQSSEEIHETAVEKNKCMNNLNQNSGQTNLLNTQLKHNARGPTACKRKCTSMLNTERFKKCTNEKSLQSYDDVPTETLETLSDSADDVKRRKVPKREDLITFRVSCKCNGRKGRKVRPELLARQIGYRLQKLMHWKVDLRNPLLEISVHLNDESLVVGIPLTRTPLSKRNYIRYFGLRGTIAWIMADLLDIQESNIVLDPLCGKCTILIEAAKKHNEAIFIGSDLSDDQLHFAEENLKYAGLTGIVHLLKSDTRVLPLSESSVDRVLTDAPFGKKFSTDVNIISFYNQFLQEIARILKPGGRMVLLTNTEIYRCLSQCGQLIQSQTLSCSGKMLQEVDVSPSRETTRDNNSRNQDAYICKTSDKECVAINTDNDNSCMSSTTNIERHESYMCQNEVESGPKAARSDDRIEKEEMEQVLVLRDRLCKSVTQSFTVLDSHYIKLGETDAYLIILQRRQHVNK